MIRKTFNYVVENFGFDNLGDFYNSLIHSRLLMLTIPLAGLSSVIKNIFGLEILTILAFVILITLELITGLISSKVNGIKIESKKFARFGLKIFVWVTLLFIINTIRKEWVGKDGVLGSLSYELFDWLHGTLFIYITLEYLISVLENLNKILGVEDDNSITTIISKKIKKFFNDETK
jgi:predicted permease